MKKFFSFLSLALLSAPLFAAEEAAPRGREGTFIQTLIMIAIAIVFFYFILWRPEQKRRKAMEQKRSSIQKGDEVTAMGIIGTVSQLKEKTVVLRMVDGAKIEMLKAAITDVKAAHENVSTVEEVKAEK